MNLKQNKFKENYNSVSDDVFSDFLFKAISGSEEYSRFGGEFTSKNFAYCAEGLQKFIENKGHMKIIVTSYFTKEDAKAINEGLTEKSKLIEDDWISQLSEIKNKFEKEHTKALAWLLKNKFLEIKIAQITDRHGKVVDSEQYDYTDEMKKKFGIFWDGTEDGLLAFEGTMDYDNKKFGNFYSIDVHRKWKGESDHCNKLGQKFRNYWNNEKNEIADGVFLKTIELPEAIKNHLIKIAPESESEINLERQLYLRPHQRKAVQAWIKNNFRGIYEMATGTGKTITAIGSINEIRKINEKLVTIIACPTKTLASQWNNILKSMNKETLVTPGNNNWYKDLKDEVLLINANKKSTLHIITSYPTLSNPKFQNKIKEILIKKLIIADEAHNAGAPINQLGLIDEYDYRLGLTATPKRYFDEEGTDFLYSYFNDVVFEYGLESAIKDGWLVPYYYYTKLTELNADEFEKYRADTRIMGANSERKTKQSKKFYKDAANDRSRIVQNAENKIDTLKEVANERNLDFSLIFTAPKLIDEIQKVLIENKPPIYSRKITQKDTPKNEQREEIFRGLERGSYNSILAIKIMDEGIDIPALKTCVIVSSTGNPKQFIQRRGRVLRPYSKKYPDGSEKEYATIIDFHVINEIPEDAEEDEIKIERSMAMSTLKRFEEMAKIAINKKDAIKEINRIKSKYKIEEYLKSLQKEV